jgi:putative transcriptional regulator
VSRYKFENVMSTKTEHALSGKVLLSHPKLRHDAFRNTVVFLMSHTAQGAAGIILNRARGKTVGEVAPGFACSALGRVPLYEGGPVKCESLMFTAWYHVAGGGFQIKCGLSKEQATDISAAIPDAQLRCFIGHAGWTAGQLESELSRNGWAVAPVNFDLIRKENGKKLWQAFLKEYHPGLRMLAEAPEDLGEN